MDSINNYLIVGSIVPLEYLSKHVLHGKGGVDVNIASLSLGLEARRALEYQCQYLLGEP